jgi:hypothetical protein
MELESRYDPDRGLKLFGPLLEWTSGIAAEDPSQECQISMKMISIVIFTTTLPFTLAGNIREFSIPDPLIVALFGVALLTLAAFIKRIGGDGC